MPKEITNKVSKDNTYCCVPQCKSKGSNNPELSFHRFPTVKTRCCSYEDTALRRRMQWICALRIGKEVTKRMSVCSKHFKNTDYVLPYIPSKRPHLKRTAIPSLYLPSASTDSVEAVAEKRKKVDKYRKKKKLASEVQKKSKGPIKRKILKEKRNIAAEALLQLSDVVNSFEDIKYEWSSLSEHFN